MTAEEKAKELVDKFKRFEHPLEVGNAKRCALIAIDEVINELESLMQGDYDMELSFFDRVKKEIENL